MSHQNTNSNSPTANKTVYIPCPGGHDFSAAKEYGTLSLMTDRVHPKYSTSLMYRDFYPVIEESKPDDYLLVVGPTIQILIATTMFATKHGRVNLLIFDHGEYIEKTIFYNFTEKEKGEEKEKEKGEEK